MISLEQLMNMQRNFMRALGIPEIPHHEEYLNNPYFQAAVDGLVTESAEVLDAISTRTKPWKQVPIEKTREMVLEESVDVMFMLLEVFVMANLSEDQIFQLYKRKMHRNLERIPAGGQQSLPGMGPAEFKSVVDEYVDRHSEEEPWKQNLDLFNKIHPEK